MKTPRRRVIVAGLVFSIAGASAVWGFADASGASGVAPTAGGGAAVLVAAHRTTVHRPTAAKSAAPTTRSLEPAPTSASSAAASTGGGAGGASSTGATGAAGVAGTQGVPDTAGLAAVPAETAFIEQAQLPDGAIETYPASGNVNPYMGAYGALGLARAATVTGDGGDAAAAWRWVDWYASAEDPDGVVFDGTVQGSTVVQGDSVDSQDATAGMFLVAAENAWGATHDAAQLQSAMNGVTGAVQAIAAVQDSDGLTWALPGYHVKYLMDQAETYGGLVSAAALAAAAGDAPLLQQATSMATELANGVNSLWDPATGAYDWARHGDGVQQQTDWDVAYPDAFEQAWAVAYNLVPAARAATLMATVVQHVAAWGQPGTTATFRTNGSLGTQQLGYWPVVGWALADVGESGQANSGTDAISEFAARSTDAWPFTPAIAGELVVAASGGAAVPSA